MLRRYTHARKHRRRSARNEEAATKPYFLSEILLAHPYRSFASISFVSEFSWALLDAEATESLRSLPLPAAGATSQNPLAKKETTSNQFAPYYGAYISA